MDLSGFLSLGVLLVNVLVITFLVSDGSVSLAAVRGRRAARQARRITRRSQRDCSHQWSVEVESVEEVVVARLCITCDAQLHPRFDWELNMLVKWI